MLALTIILAIFLSAVVYTLFAPFYFDINSDTGLLQFRLHRLASVHMATIQDRPCMKIKIAWWSREIALGSRNKKAVQKAPGHHKKAPRKLSYRKMLKIVKSFKIRKCIITIDTGSMHTDAILYPAALWASNKTGKDIAINFWDENRIILEVENCSPHGVGIYNRLIFFTPKT